MTRPQVSRARGRNPTSNERMKNYNYVYLQSAFLLQGTKPRKTHALEVTGRSQPSHTWPLVVSRLGTQPRGQAAQLKPQHGHFLAAL